MYTFIIDLIPNTGPYTGLYNQRGSKFKVVGGVPFFYFSDMCISGRLKAKK